MNGVIFGIRLFCLTSHFESNRRAFKNIYIFLKSFSRVMDFKGVMDFKCSMDFKEGQKSLD